MSTSQNYTKTIIRLKLSKYSPTFTSPSENIVKYQVSQHILEITLEKRFWFTKLKRVPISWATIPLNQHPGASLMIWRLPVLPTFNEQLRKNVQDEFTVRLLCAIWYIKPICSPSNVYAFGKHKGQSQSIFCVPLVFLSWKEHKETFKAASALGLPQSFVSTKIWQDVKRSALKKGPCI